MRKGKIFGLALMALIAVSALLATAASADEFTATVYPATVTGTAHPEFTEELVLTTGTQKCKKVSYHGTLKEKSTSLTMTPAYSECTAFGFPGTVNTNGCDYLFRVNGGSSTEGTMDILCPAGKEITIVSKSGETVKCTVHIPAQSNLAGVTYSNIGASGPTEEITVSASLSKINYTHTAGTGIGACSSGAASGTWKFKMLWTGEEDSIGVNHIGLLLSSA